MQDSLSPPLVAAFSARTLCPLDLADTRLVWRMTDQIQSAAAALFLRYVRLQGWIQDYSAVSLSSKKNLKFFAQYSLYRIFGRMHGTLNIGKK
jgi:hypothetical protein